MSQELEESEKFRFYELPHREKEKVLERIRKLLATRNEILLAVVYGSFLKNSSFRDIDVAVYVKGSVDTLDYELGLEEELSKHVGYPVDVKVLNEAPPWFTKKVLREGRVIVSNTLFITEKLYLKALDEEVAMKNTSKGVH